MSNIPSSLLACLFCGLLECHLKEMGTRWAAADCDFRNNVWADWAEFLEQHPDFSFLFVKNCVTGHFFDRKSLRSLLYGLFSDLASWMESQFRGGKADS